MSLDGLQAFLAQNRALYKFLHLSFSDPVVMPSDPKGRGGTVGFGFKARAQRKSDGVFLRASVV
jgi:hypothetical protein